MHSRLFFFYLLVVSISLILETDHMLVGNGQMCFADGLSYVARKVDLHFYGNRQSV